MIAGLLALLACQLVGELVVDLTGLPVPGPVAGMVILLGWLTWRRPPADAPVLRAGDALLRHLQLLFVPAGVGVVAHLAVIGGAAVAVVGGIALSWAAGLAAAAYATLGLLRLTHAGSRA